MSSIDCKPLAWRIAGDEGQRPRVLLVENSPSQQAIISVVLDALGYRYTVAENGKEALFLRKRDDFDAILMDVRMPIMNGFKATLLIRQWERKNKLPRMPIIGLTSLDLAGDQQLCLKAGMDDYVAKPVPVDILRRKIETHILSSLVGLRTDGRIPSAISVGLPASA